jgi:hypothetical protein
MYTKMQKTVQTPRLVFFDSLPFLPLPMCVAPFFGVFCLFHTQVGALYYFMGLRVFITSMCQM